MSRLHIRTQPYPVPTAQVSAPRTWRQWLSQPRRHSGHPPWAWIPFFTREACKGSGFNCPHFVGCRHSKAKLEDHPRTTANLRTRRGLSGNHTGVKSSGPFLLSFFVCPFPPYLWISNTVMLAFDASSRAPYTLGIAHNRTYPLFQASWDVT